MSKELAKKEEAGLPAVINFGEDAGAGFEGASAESYAIPFLRQLQAMSGQCKKQDPSYIKGAEEGDFYNTVTEKLYKGEDGVMVIPCYYVQKYNEWAPDRGGFRGSHTVAEYAGLRKMSAKDNQGREYEANVETGNVLQDTREHYVLILNPDGTTEPALLAMTGSQLKKSKKWMTLMQGICGSTKPMFSQIYKITAVGESNDKGSWAGMKAEHASEINNIDQYNAAKMFRDMVRSGAAQAAPVDEESPF